MMVMGYRSSDSDPLLSDTVDGWNPAPVGTWLERFIPRLAHDLQGFMATVQNRSTPRTNDYQSSGSGISGYSLLKNQME